MSVMYCLQQTGNGLLISFNPVTGALLSGRQGQGHDLGFKVVQAEMLAEMDAEFLKGLILIDDHNKVRNEKLISKETGFELWEGCQKCRNIKST